jgi:hypothetical protein
VAGCDGATAPELRGWALAVSYDMLSLSISRY